MNREEAFELMSELDDSLIAESIRYAPRDAVKASERIVHMKKRRLLSIALAAALVLTLGAVAFARSVVPRSVGTHLMPRDATYETLAKLPQIEKDVGYPVTAPERFSNGYAFDSLRVGGEAVFGEGKEILREYYGVYVDYTKPGVPKLMLHLMPVLELEGGSEAPEPTEQRTVDGVTVNLSLDHYKAVPEDYEKTAEDLEREAAGHYYISWGSNAVREYEVAFAGFELDGVSYTLMDMAATESSLDTLTQMAEELIASAT